MESKELLIDTGLFIGQSEFNSPLPESSETINNLLKTIKEYRDYSHPDSFSWKDYVREYFHILGFNTVIKTQRFFSLELIGSNNAPKAIVGFVHPSENISEIIPGLDWETVITYASNYYKVDCGIITNGLELKILGLHNDHHTSFWCNLDSIIINERQDSFFTLYKVFTFIKGRTYESIPKHNLWEKSTIKKSDLVSEYDLAYHTQNKPSYIIGLFEALRSKIYTLSNLIGEKYNKVYIGYSEGKNFCEVEFFTDQLKIWVDVNIDLLFDPLSICKDVRKIGHHGTGNTEILLNQIEDVDAVFEIIKQSFIRVDKKEILENNKELGERDILRKEFWTLLLEKAKLRTSIHKNLSPVSIGWIGGGSGKSGIQYIYTIRLKDAMVELYIDNGEIQWNKHIFDFFYQHKGELENVFGESLDWRRLEDHRSSRIIHTYSDYGLLDKDHWPELQNQLIDKMVHLEKAFKPFIMKL